MTLTMILNYTVINIALLTIWGAIVYRVYALNNLGVIISILLTALSFFILHRFGQKYNKKISPRLRQASLFTQKIQFSLIEFILLFSYLTLLGLLIYILISSRATSAIISPWQVAPPCFFALFASATALVFLAVRQNKYLGLILIFIHYLFCFSVAVIVYRLGYGFDPFIHQATVDLISKTGSVDPKPFYYLGQYALEIIIHKTTGLPLVWLDRLLVPLLAGLLLPLVLYQVLGQWLAHKKTIVYAILLLLILPFAAYFIVTTPQHLAFLFLILTLIFGFFCASPFTLIIIYLLASAALVTQPIAGIPALLFALLLTVYHSDKKEIKKYLYRLIFLITALALPLAFYFVEKMNAGATRALPVENSNNILSWPAFIIPGQENFILNWLYLYGFNIKYLIAALALAGAILAYRYRQQCRIVSLYLLMATSLFISYFLSRLISFNFLINYERSNFPDRILLIAVFFLLPFIILVLYRLVEKISALNIFFRISWTVFAIILITTSLYFSYPRFDHYHNSHGYSVSQNDINAVRWIETNALEDYIVLANQQVSAAALKEYGFAKYYQSTIDNQKSEIFFYPIPTGGPLYGYYLDMVYEHPSRATMAAAMDLVGVFESYFVLNKYWWAFPKILEEAKLSADSHKEFDNGEIYVFRYTR